MNSRRGIILSGGSGTRLHPLTLATSKQLLPVYDKPMVYYPLSTLMQAGIRETLVITTRHDRPAFERLLGDGLQWGLWLEYATQEKPDGIARALTIGRDFLAGAPSALVLGDNIYLRPRKKFSRLLRWTSARDGATVFGRRVADPQRYGVATFNEHGTIVGIEEKPAHPKSDTAVTGLYFYDERAPEFAESLRPSSRGEMEITDLNRRYIAEGSLRVETLGEDYEWFDAGTHDSLLEAGACVQKLQASTGQRLGCPESIARENGWI